MSMDHLCGTAGPIGCAEWTPAAQPPKHWRHWRKLAAICTPPHWRLELCPQRHISLPAAIWSCSLGGARLLYSLSSEESTCPSGTEAIVAAGTLPRLVQLLGAAHAGQTDSTHAGHAEGTDQLLQYVSTTLINLTTEESASAAIAAAGGVAALLSLLSLLRPSTGLHAARDAARAMAALSNLARFPSAADVAAEGGMPLILSQLTRQDRGTCSQTAAQFVKNVAAYHPHMVDASTAAAATAGLVSFSARQLNDSHGEGMRLATDALVALYRSSAANRQTVASALSQLQRSRDGRVKEAAGMLAACLLEQAGNLTSDAHIG